MMGILKKRRFIRTSGLLSCLVAILLFPAAPTINGQQKKSLPPAVSTLPRPNDRYALIIGVETYDDSSSITSIKGPNNDAIEISRALKSYAGFPEENVTILASNLSEAQQPTATNIYVQLAELAGRVPPEGLLLIAFSGHGIEIEGETFLLPKDARLRGNKGLLRATSLDIPKLKSIIGGNFIKQVIILLDSCREDPSAAKGLGDNNLTSATVASLNLDDLNKNVEAFAVLYATSIGKRSYIIPNKVQGYFSAAFVAGLAGKAKNANNEVTLSSLIKYLQESVPLQVRRELKQDQRPSARVEGFNAEALVLARVPSSANVSPVVPNTGTGPRRDDLAAEAAQHAAAGSQFFTTATNSGDWQKFDKQMYEALLEYRVAESLQPENALYRINAGAALLRLGRYDEAVVKFREGIRLGPTLPWFHNELCIALRRLRHYDEADPECIKAVADVNNRKFQDDLEAFLIRAEKARLTQPGEEIVVDLSGVDTATAPGHFVAADPYLVDYGISVTDRVPAKSRIVIQNNLAIYGGQTVRSNLTQNFLTQMFTDNEAASFKLVLSKTCESVSFTRPALLAGPSGITHPAWSAYALDREGRVLSSQSEGIVRSFANVPARTYTLTAPGFDPIAEIRFDSDPRLNGVPFAAFSTLLIEQLTMKCKN